MKYISGIIFFFLVFSFSAFSQVESKSNIIDKDKDKFEENAFNKEFGDSNDTTDQARKRYDKIPEKLPDWIFSPLDLQNSTRIVAYSDPNMVKEEAYEQAILRAKAMYAIMKYCTVSNITDDYTNLKESGKYSLYTTKFQDFSQAKAEMAYDNSVIRVIDTFYTKYDEAIVYIDLNHKLSSDENKDTLIVKGEHLQIFTERSFKNEKIEFFNLSIQDNLNNNDSTVSFTQYNYRKVNRGYDIYSMYGNKSIEFVERTYNYRTELDFAMDSTKLEFNTYRLSKGLWNAYVSGILSNVTVLSKKLSSFVKNSNDNYILKNEGLIRTVARNKVSFWYNDFEMFQNHFYIDLNGQIE